MNKVLLDSNIFLRLLAGDVPRQKNLAEKLFLEIEEGKVKGLVSILVINEVVWVMDNFYELNRGDYLPKLIQLLSLKNIVFLEVRKAELMKVLESLASGPSAAIDFTDFYLTVKANRKITVASFDKHLSKLGNKVRV